jgi:hypothetical protein
MQSTGRDTTDLLRACGALLLAAGATALFIRKGLHHGWSDFPMLLLVALPAGLLFRLAMPAEGNSVTVTTAEPSRAVMMVAAIGLSLPAITELLLVLGADTGKPLVTAVILLLAGLVAGYGAVQARVPYAALLAALATLIVWLILWGQTFEHPNAGDFRGVLVFGGVLLLFAAYWRAQQGSFGAREIATVGGLALIAAGTLGIFVGAGDAFAHALDPVFTKSHGQLGSTTNRSGGQSLGWDLYLMVVSVALIWLGARVRSRGIAYTGGFGIVLFILSVGYQVARLDAGKSSSGSLTGWPLALLILGFGGLIAAAMRRDEP